MMAEKIDGSVIYRVFFRVDSDNPLYHICSLCNDRLKQDIKRGYTSCVNHITKSTKHADFSWREELERILGCERLHGGDILSFVRKKVAPAARTLFRWLEWIAMNDEPFSIVENKYVRKRWNQFVPSPPVI